MNINEISEIGKLIGYGGLASVVILILYRVILKLLNHNEGLQKQLIELSKQFAESSENKNFQTNRLIKYVIMLVRGSLKGNNQDLEDDAEEYDFEKKKLIKDKPTKEQIQERIEKSINKKPEN